MDTPLTINVDHASLKAAAEGCVTLIVNFGAGDVIDIKNAAYTSIYGIHFVAAVPRVSGALLHVENATHTDLRISAEGTLSTRFADMILVGAGSHVTRIGPTYLANATGSCIRIDGYAVDTYLSEVNTADCKVGLDLHDASGVYMDRLDLVGSRESGFIIDPPAGSSVNAVYGSAVLSDTSSMDGVVLAGSGDITEVNIVNLWSSDSGTSGTFTTHQMLRQPSRGVYFNNPRINGVSLTNLRAKGNGGDGVFIRSGSNIQLTGAQALMNGASAAPGHPPTGGAEARRFDGIHIGGDAANVIVSGAIAGSGGFEQAAGLKNQQAWGLRREAGPVGQSVTVVNSVFSGNTEGSCKVNSSSKDHLNISGNLPVPSC